MNRLYATVVLVSCSVLMFEISLTRIFSITLWYHFAFMVISIAMLGIGSAGTVLALCRDNRHSSKSNKPGQSNRTNKLCALFRNSDRITLYSLITGISMLLAYLVSNHLPFDPARFSWERFQILYLILYCLTLSVPFFFSGLVIATVFAYYSHKSLSVYCADMTGAGAGSLLVIILLNMAPPEYAVLAASSLCCVASLIHGSRKTASVSLIFLLTAVILAMYHPDCIDLKISPYKNLSLYLRYPGAEHLQTYNSSYSRIDSFTSPGIRYAPGLSLKYSAPLPDQTGFATDGQRIDVMTAVRDRSQLSFLSSLPAAIAFDMSSKQKALILDPRGGLHVLMAQLYGFRKIVKVESDSSFLKIVRRDFVSYSGDIYSDNTLSGYGRNVLSRTSESARDRYSLIDIPMTEAAVSGSFGIAEDYRYTVNAFTQYLSSLDENGILSSSLYIIPPHRTEFRLLATLISAQELLGIPTPSSGIAALRSWDVMTVLAKKSPFTDGEIITLKKFCDDRNFDLVYYPAIREDETNRFIKTTDNELFNGFRSILDPATRSSFIENYLFDIKPVYDRNPFFHYFLKAVNIHSIYKKMDRKILYFLHEGYLLPVLLGVVALLSGLIILLPASMNRTGGKAIANRKNPTQSNRGRILYALLYFGMLGLGFMFTEVQFIQTSILALENPSLSVAIVLSLVLISSGAGSLIASMFQSVRSPQTLLVLVVLIILFSVLQPSLFSTITRYELPVRILVLSAGIIPIGLLMGIPFPMGMIILGTRQKSLIPWAWAVNACMSVIAPLLAIMVALLSGFHSVLWLSGLAYLMASGALIQLRRR